jgi:hypothetical protein
MIGSTDVYFAMIKSILDWETHLVSDHWLEYVRSTEPSRFFVDYVELSR